MSTPLITHSQPQEPPHLKMVLSAPPVLLLHSTDRVEEQYTPGLKELQRQQAEMINQLEEVRYYQGILNCFSNPFSRIRALRRDFDGHDSEPPSEALIQKGEKFWLALTEHHLNEMPIVKAGGDDLLTYSWLEHYPDPHMEISIYEKENSNYTYEWFIRKNGKITSGLGPFSCDQLVVQVLNFFA